MIENEITFDHLPKAVAQLSVKVDNIERLLLQKNEDHHSESEEILTVSGAAKLLNLSEPTIYSKVHKRELPHMKRGKRLYFSRTELLKWLQQGKRKTVVELEKEAGDFLVNRKNRREKV